MNSHDFERIEKNGSIRPKELGYTSTSSVHRSTTLDDSALSISVKENIGIDLLLNRLKEKSLGSNSFTEKSAVINNVRHYDALSKAKNDLNDAIKSLNNNLSGEFVSVNLRGAEDSLGEIIGKVTTDDILNNIFDNFCIGK